MGLKTQRKGQIGVNVVESIVMQQLRSRWQVVDSHNDDGTDGLIFLEDSAGEATGQIIFVQIKYWNVDPSNGVVKLAISSDKLKKQIGRWSRVAGAAILVWVDPKTRKAFWTNLHDPTSFVGSAVVVKLSNEFGDKSRRRLGQICGTLTMDSALPLIVASKDDLAFFGPTIPLKTASKTEYKNIGAVKSPNPELGEVTFGRVGWKHMTRARRPVSRIIQSLQLIKLARRIVEEVGAVRLVRKLTDPSAPAEIYAITARVVFPGRDAAVVRVILLRQLPGERVERPRTWFYSVYERRRRLGLKGEHWR